MQVKDTGTRKTGAAPAGALTSYSTGMDLGNSARGDLVAGMEILVSAPAQTVGRLPDTQTIAYSLQMDHDSAFGSPTDILGTLITQTGAGGAGAVAATAQVRLPVHCERYLRLKMVKTGAADASAVKGKIEAVF